MTEPDAEYEADPDRKEQHRVDTIGRWDPPEAEWAEEYDWTRYRGPAAYPCPGAWVLDEPEGLAYSWLWFPEIGEDYGTESSAFDDLEYSSIDSYREARAFLIGEDVAESLREEEIEWTLSIDNVDVFVRRDLEQDELMGAVAEVLSRYPDGDWRDVTPTAGSPPPEVVRERELEQRREENESLDDFATDGGQPDGGIPQIGETEPCHICGRATRSNHKTRFVFGLICERAECQRVKTVLEEQRLWNFQIHLPTHGHDGVPSWWDFDGEVSKRAFA